MRISPKALLGVADTLAGTTAGPGRPLQAAHRRAVSTAYYALFHRLAMDTARAAVPDGAATEHLGVARYVSHTSVKTVCEWIGGSAPPKHLALVIGRLRANAELTDVAQAFLTLYENRERADYDHGALFDKKTTLLLVGRARRAVDQSFARRDGADFAAFYGLIALRLNVADRR